MNSQCQQARDRLAELALGIAPAAEERQFAEHLAECSSCRQYAEALQAEDELLAALFADLDDDLARQEQEVIEAVNCCAREGAGGIGSLLSTVIESRFAKLAAVAALIGFLVVDYLIAMSWISEIQGYIESSSVVLSLR